jgi:hypothetical protein
MENTTIRSWPVLLLAAPAFVAIWSGWVGLGGLTGFGMVKPLPGIWDDLTVNSAITLPVGVETYAAYALHVWLTPGAHPRAAQFAKYSALGSLVLGAGGQVAYHLMVAAGMEHAPWQITAVVACLPVAVLGMGAALAHLVMAVHAVTDAGGETGRAATGGGVVARLMRTLRLRRAPQDAPQASAPAPAPGYQVHPDARVEPVDSTDDDDTEEEAPKPTPASRTATPGPSRRPAGTSTGVKVARLRRQHPDWTVGQIAVKAGCSARTARRHLNTTDQGPGETGSTAGDVAA